MNLSHVRRRLSQRFSRLRRERELNRITGLPRRVSGHTDLAGRELAFIDGPSFASAYRAIFEAHIYRFAPTGPAPRIIDCGANIGLAIVYWKHLFPDCRITAFEPDESALVALKENCSRYDDVELIQAAVWTSEGEERFLPDGADAGRLDIGSTTAGMMVRTVRVQDWLSEPVDLLKLDIEGSEVAVLEDCSDQLRAVDNVFLEYHGFSERAQDLDIALRILSSAGFRWHIQPEYVAPTPFLSTPTDAGMDQRLNIFAFRRSPSGDRR